MKRKPGRYVVGDIVRHRAWKRKGVIAELPKNHTPLSKAVVDWDDGNRSETWVSAIMLDPQYVKKLVKRMKKTYWVPKKGQRVRIPSVNVKGTVEFVNTNDLFFNERYAIQVTLDKPYDDSGQLMLRTNLTDIEKIKKKKKAPEPPPADEDELLWDDDETEEMTWD